MRIIGQFNLGFIIAELRDDLFILDQHACDEKYRYRSRPLFGSTLVVEKPKISSGLRFEPRTFPIVIFLIFVFCFSFLHSIFNRFETLQKKTVIHQQPLIIPQFIEAHAAEEIIIMENISIFESNGFRIKVDEEAPPGRKIQLLAVPFSKHVQFSQVDVHELASLIGESMSADGGSYMSNLMLKNDKISFVSETKENSSGEERPSQRDRSFQPSIRIPKLVSMFASRACRSAIMIGTAMNPHEMRGVVGRLEGIEQPWNCPHGRPTMRHLIDLQSVHRKRKSSASYVDTSNVLSYESLL